MAIPTYDTSEAFRIRLNQRIKRVMQYRAEHPHASIADIANATGYLPSSIKLWLGEDEDEDQTWRIERRKKLHEIIYGRSN